MKNKSREKLAMHQIDSFLFFLLIIGFCYCVEALVVGCIRLQRDIEALEKIQKNMEPLPLSFRFAEKKSKFKKDHDRSLQISVFDNVHRRPFIIFTNYYYYMNEEKRDYQKTILENENEIEKFSIVFVREKEKLKEEEKSDKT